MMFGNYIMLTKTFPRQITSHHENPGKLKELQDIFFQEATKNHVFPIDDRRAERFNAASAGRPDLMGPRTSLTFLKA
jgi:hypothetical protein